MSSIRQLHRILRDCRRIAVVGLSTNWHRPSYFAASYLLAKGYEVIPITPMADEILGQQCYPSLADVPGKIDMVDCFRREQELPALAEQAVDIGAKVFWMQLGLNSPEAHAIATAAGLEVVVDRCVKIEHARLYGGLNWCGVNTGVISARRALAT